MNAPESGGGAEFDFERASADDLVSSGRLYRETARQNGDLQLAQMLTTSNPCWRKWRAAPAR